MLGKLVLVVGLATLALLHPARDRRVAAADAPVGMVIAVLGAIGTTVVLIRLILIPDDYIGFGRSVGIWISLVSAVLLIVAGLLKSAEEA